MDRGLLTDVGAGGSGEISSLVSSLWFVGTFCAVVNHEMMKACFPLTAIAL